MEWNHPEVAQSMFSLVKSGGFFKSIKQRNFLRAPKGYPWHVVIYDFDNMGRYPEETVTFFRENFNIPDMQSTDTVVMCSGEIRWADYGRKSWRRVEHVFLLDDYGVRGQYKLKFGYDDKTGSSWVEASKTEVVWTRDPSAELPVFVEAPKPEVAPSNWIGEVKQRLEFTGTITNARHVSDSMYGPVYLTTVKVGDDEVLYWGLLTYIEYRGEIKFKATVKEHSEYNGRKQTVVNRPKVIEEEVTA